MLPHIKPAESIEKLTINLQNDCVTLQPSKMVWQCNGHCIWCSTLLAICLNYHSSCIVKKSIVWLCQAPWICIISRRSFSALKAFMQLKAWPLHHIFISQRQNIRKETHMKMCAMWEMSTVINCGCHICHLWWCDAFVQ